MGSKRKAGRLKRWLIAALLIMSAMSILLVDLIQLLQ